VVSVRNRSAEEHFIEKFNTVKGMVFQVLRDNSDARNSQEWTCHIVQRECADKYFGKELQDLSKQERLMLPKRSSIARAMREIQNDKGKFVADEEVQIDREVKRKALHKNYSDSKRVTRHD
jgi:hypothetical protein